MDDAVIVAEPVCVAVRLGVEVELVVLAELEVAEVV